MVRDPDNVNHPVHNLALKCCHHIAIPGLVLGNGRNTQVKFCLNSNKPVLNPVSKNSGSLKASVLMVAAIKASATAQASTTM